MCNVTFTTATSALYCSFTDICPKPTVGQCWPLSQQAHPTCPCECRVMRSS